MKLKYLMCISVFVFLLALPSAFSADFSVGGYNFQVPEGYSVNMTSDNSTTLVCDNNSDYSIFITLDEAPDAEVTKMSRQNAGFKFLSEEDFVSNSDVVINQQNFIKNESYYSFYSCDVNGTSFLVGYTFPVHDDFAEGEDNPAILIIDSIE